MSIAKNAGNLPTCVGLLPDHSEIRQPFAFSASGLAEAGGPRLEQADAIVSRNTDAVRAIVDDVREAWFDNGAIR